MLDQPTLNKIKKEAIHLDWDIAFNGKSKGNRHLFRVVKISKYLAKEEGADIKVCTAGAWMHDAGLIAGNDDDPQKVRRIVEEILKKIGVEGVDLSRIADCAEAHEGISTALSLEAKVIHDADVLDKAGILGVIRHCWKIVNMINPNATTQEIYQTIKSHLKDREHRLYTDTAKKIIKILTVQLDELMNSPETAQDLIGQISILARRGIISDKIAMKLIKQDVRGITRNLESQLRCDYLNNLSSV